MSEALTYRKLFAKMGKLWLALLVYTFGVAALVNGAGAPFWVAQVGMGVAAVATLVWFWRTFSIGKRIREQHEMTFGTFRKKP